LSWLKPSVKDYVFYNGKNEIWKDSTNGILTQKAAKHLFS